MSAAVNNSTLTVEKYSASAFVEQRTANSEPMIRNMTTDTVAATTLTTTDVPWQLQDMLTKPQLVKNNIPWPATATSGSLLYTVFLPQDLNVNGSVPYNILNLMTYHRYGFRVKVTLTASQFHAGQLAIIASPLALKTGGSARPANFDSLGYRLSLPHVRLVAELSNSAEFDIPFSMLESMWSRFSAFDTSAVKLDIVVLNQLQAVAAAPQTVYSSVFVSLLAPELHVPVNFNSVSTAFFPNDTIPQGKEVSNSKASDSHSQNEGAISALTSAAASGAAAIAQAETNPLGAVKSGIDATEKAISGFSSLFAGNFDKPNTGSTPINFIRQTVPNFALGGNAETNAYELSLYPKTLHAPPFSYFGMSHDCMDIKGCVSLPSLYTSASITESQLPGTLLQTIPIYPTRFNFDNGLFNINPSWMSSISSHFALWRGSIRLHFQAVATRFHSLKLLGVFVPNQHVSIDTTSMSSNSQSPYFTWDIQEKKDIVIDLPFNVNTPFLNNPTIGYAAGISTSAASASDSISGTFYLFVLNTLVGPSDVNNSIAYNIFASAGPDFEVSQLREPGAFYEYTRYKPAVLLDNDTIPQGLDTDVEDGTDNITQKDLQSAPVTIALQNEDSLTPAPVAPLYLGDVYNHLKDPMRRLRLVSSHNIIFPTTNPQNSIGFQTIPVTPNFNDIHNGNSTDNLFPQIMPLDHFAQHFAMWSGKMEYIISVQASNPTLVNVAHFQDRYYDATNGIFSILDVNADTLRITDKGYPTTMFNTYTQQAQNVVVPWTQKFPACYTDYDLSHRLIEIPDQTGLVSPRADLSNLNRARYFNGTLMINITSMTAQTIRLQVYQGAGDDFQSYVHTAPPPIQPFGVPVLYPTLTFKDEQPKKSSVARISYSSRLDSSLSAAQNIFEAVRAGTLPANK